MVGKEVQETEEIVQLETRYQDWATRNKTLR